MKQKPLFFIILGVLHLLEPFSKILFFKSSTDFSLITIFNNVLAMGDPLKFFEFWFLFPLGGVALISVKNWSYPLFYLVQGYSVFSHLSYQSYHWPYLAKTPFWSSLTLLAINLVLMTYFLLPKVRQPFLDKRFRWWETNKRFYLGVLATVWCHNDTDKTIKSVKLDNISLTGCLIIGELGAKFDEINIKFEVTGVEYMLKGSKVRESEFQGVSRTAYRFNSVGKERKKLKKLIKCLKIIGKEFVPSMKRVYG